MDLLTRSIKKVQGGFFKLLYPAIHIRSHVTGGSVEDCLRQLEKETGLPKEDLSILDEPPRKMATLLGQCGDQYIIRSKSQGKKRQSDEGYVAGTIFKPTSKVKPSVNVTGFTLLAAAVSNQVAYFGSIHVCKNHQGTYEDGVCTTCGDKLH